MAKDKRGINTAADIKKRIEELKSVAEDRFSVCRLSAKKLLQANKVYRTAKAKEEKNSTKKTEAKLLRALDEFNIALKEHRELYSDLEDTVSRVCMLYEELVEATASLAKAKKISREAEKFAYEYSDKKAKLREMTEMIPELNEVSEEESVSDGEENLELNVEQENDVLERRDEENVIPEAPAQPQAAQPGAQPQMPPYYYPYPPMPGYMPMATGAVNVAPATIDIAPIVEDAVKSAMEKFKAAFDGRADEYVKAMSQSAANIAEMEAKVAEDEKYVIEKLASVMESVKVILDEITALGASAMQLTNAQRDAASAQKKINDMQRALARDLQGVQVNQRLINQEQAAIAEEQVVILEEERATAEAQAAIAAARAAVGINSVEETVIKPKRSRKETKELSFEKKTEMRTPEAIERLADAPITEAAPVSEVTAPEFTEAIETSKPQEAAAVPETAEPKADGAAQVFVFDTTIPKEVELDELKADDAFGASEK